jgi:hypothetical protein
MSGIYEIWKAYAMFIVETVFAYFDRIEVLPDVIAMSVLILHVLAINWFLPLWAVLLIYAVIGLPMVWFFGAMSWAVFTNDFGRQYR